MKFVNLTPHQINIKKNDGTMLTLPKCDNPARCDQSETKVSDIEGIAIYQMTFGEVNNLPTPIVGTAYIVSRLVLDASNDRDDLFSPGQLIRDADGNPVGCKGLSR